MATDPTAIGTTNWRSDLPTLAGRLVVLREIGPQDLGPLVDLLSLSDATRFGLDEPVSEVSAQELIERAVRERAAGLSFTYVITLAARADRRRPPAGAPARSELRSRGMGVHARAVVARQRHLPRSGAARRIVRVRHGRRAPSRGARAAAERARERRAPQARRGAGRRAAPVDPPRRRIPRSGALVDAQGRLGRPLGVDRRRGSTDDAAADVRAASTSSTVVVLGRSRVRRVPPAGRSSISRCCSLAPAAAVVDVGGAQGLPAADHGRLDDVGVVRGRFRVAAAARPARDDDRRRGQRVQPVQSEQARSATRCTARCSAWRRSSSRCRAPGSRSGCSAAPVRRCRSPRSRVRWSARRRSTSCSTPVSSRRRSRCRRATTILDDLAQQLPVERAELFRRRRHRGARGVAGRHTPATGWRRSPSRRST